nr:VENN motif pre-toxin domain-containing protein [Psychrobacter sp. BF1]
MTEKKPQGGLNGLGYGTDSDSDSSITKAGITGIAGNSGITTDNQAEYAGALENVFEATRVNEELGAQTEITQAFDQERRKVKTDINAKEKILRDEAEEAYKNGDDQVGNEKLAAANRVKNQGLLFDSISGAIYGPNSNGVTGYVAKAASPFVSNQIGQYYKELADGQGGSLTGAQQAGHILAHGILGAATSSATGNDVLTGGLSAGAGEATAPLISKFLYGTTDPSKLTAEQKDTISSITSALGAGIGLTTGNVSDAVNAAETSKVAVENNHLNYKDTLARESWKSILEGCEGSQSKSCMSAREEVLKLNAKDAFQREVLIAACSNPTSANCTAAKKEALAMYKELSDAARPKGVNSAFGKEKNELGGTLSSLPTGTITAIDPYEDYLKTFEGRLAKSTAEGLILEIEGLAVARLLQPLTKAGSKAYDATRKWRGGEVALASAINKNVRSLSPSDLKLLDDYLLGKKASPITYADRARQSNANVSKSLNDIGKRNLGTSTNVRAEDIKSLVVEHSKSNPSPLTDAGAKSIMREALPQGTSYRVAGDEVAGPDVFVDALTTGKNQTTIQVKSVSGSPRAFESQVKNDLDKPISSNGGSKIIAVQVPAGSDAAKIQNLQGKLGNFSETKVAGRQIIVVDSKGEVLIPLTPMSQFSKRR